MTQYMGLGFALLATLAVYGSVPVAPAPTPGELVIQFEDGRNPPVEWAHGARLATRDGG